MCGIVGFVGPGDKQDLERMMAAVHHRGPDGSGSYEDPGNRVFLGHRRLSIVDIDGGTQPMWSADGRICVVFNGEIYNHLDLRRELQATGHVFRTDHSDTEVLVHGYREWGSDLSLRLNGMFAFAIYDLSNRRLFLSRDRFGEKPLYYTHAGELFAFASEVHAFSGHARFSPKIDVSAVQKFFAHGYLPAPTSIYLDTYALPAGHSIVLDTSSGAFKAFPYWRFTLEPDEGLTDADEDRLSEELRALVLQSVDRRLMADVPVGLFLSGGLDSSVVLAALRQLRGADAVDTFCIGFDDPSFDESGYARETAAHFGIKHHERQVDMGSALARAPEILATLDEPFGDPSYLPTQILCAFARERVTVALTGDGGDELFAGYDPFLALGPARLYHKLVPRVLHGVLRRGAACLPHSDRNMSLDFKLNRTLMGLSFEPELWNPVWMAPLRPEDGCRLFSSPDDVETIYAEALKRWRDDAGCDLVDRTLGFFINSYLQNDILTKVDRAAMSVSLETRAVFLDVDLVEFCRKLPNRFKLRNGQRKYLLRKAFAGMLPAEVLARPKKGFGIPLNKWMRTAPAPATHPLIPGLNPEWVNRCWEAHRQRRADHRFVIWCWLSLCYMKN